MASARPRTFFGFRNLYEGSEVRRTVRRATQFELEPDIDPQANFVVHGRFHVYAPVSLGLFDERNSFRQLCVWLSTWHWWDRFVLLVIMANAIVLAIEDYSPNAIDPVSMSPDPDRSAVNAFAAAVEPIFTALFTLEATVKIVAMGFAVDRGSYMRDGFNILDFIVVVSSLLSAIPGVPRVSALRAVRVLRPLRTLSRVKSMRIMVGSLMTALPQLANVALLMAFLFLFWGIIAVQLFPGKLHSRCRLTNSPLSIPDSHLLPWLPNETAPWIAAGNLHGLLPGAAGFVLPVEESRHQPLYYEMMQTYFWGESPNGFVPSDPVLDKFPNMSLSLPAGAWSATANQITGKAQGVPWVSPNFFYVTFAQAAFYVSSLSYNRTAFPECGASSPGATGFPLFNTDWRQDTSPWATPRSCVWPSDLNNNRVCEDGTGSGAYTCTEPQPWATDLLTLPSIVKAGTSWAAAVLSVRRGPRTCGSPYDAYGNRRFENARVMRDEVTMDLNTIENGDWILPAFVFMLQSVTLESWSLLMYNLQDGYNIYFAVGFCVLLTLLGSYIVLNLIVASILMNFSVAQTAELEALRARKEKVAAIRAAEKEEVSRAITKARVVVELKTLGARPKARLRRASVEDREMLSAEAARAAAEVAAAAAAEDAFDPLIDPTSGTAHGVMRRRILQSQQLRAAPSTRRVPISAGSKHSLHAGRSFRSPGSSFGGGTGLPAPTPGSAREDASSAVSGTQEGASTLNATSVAGSEKLPSIRQLEEEEVEAADILERVSQPFRIPPSTPVLQRLRLWLLGFLGGGTFGLFMMCLIVLNTIILALDRYPIDKELEARSEQLNFTLTILFALEMTAKVSAMGMTWYAKDRMNLFDAVVVWISLIELFVSPPSFFTGAENNNNAAVLALRTLRLARIFKLARSWTSLRLLLRMLGDSMQDIANFSVLLMLFLFIMSLFGQELFANRWRLDPKTLDPLSITDPRFWDPLVYPATVYNVFSRGTFDSVWWGMLSTFQIMTMQNWNDHLMPAYRSQGWLGVLFICVIVILGGFVLISLFLAIMLGHFEGLEKSNLPEDEPQGKKPAAAKSGAKPSRRGSAVADDGRSHASKSKQLLPLVHSTAHLMQGSVRPSRASDAGSAKRSAVSSSMPPAMRGTTVAGNSGAGVFPDAPAMMSRRSLSVAARPTATATAATAALLNNDDARSVRSGKSGKTGKTGVTRRRRRSSVVKARDKTVEAGRLLRAACMRRAVATRNVVYSLGDSNVQGCLLAQRAHVTEVYGRTQLRRRLSSAVASPDASLAASPLVDLDSGNANSAYGDLVSKPAVGQNAHLRLTASRPQVLAKRSSLPGMPTIVTLPSDAAPVESRVLPEMLLSSGNLMKRTDFLRAVPATAGAKLGSLLLDSFEGSEDEDGRSRAHLSNLSSLNTDELSSRGRGTVASGASTEHGDDSGSEDNDEVEKQEPDDIYAQWQNVLAEASGSAPKREGVVDRGWCQRTMAAAGRLFMLTFCCCFIRDKNGGKSSKTANRSCFVLTERHPLRRVCIYLSGHPRFDSLVLFVIFASSVCLAMDAPNLDPDSVFNKALGVLDVIWVVFFTFEMLVRVIALGIGPAGQGTYLRSGWNVLDGSIVAVSWLSFATEGNASFRSLRALRALRALRPLRVVRRLPGLRLVVHSLFRAFWPVLNVALVCSILFLIFAIVLTGLFKGALSTCTGNHVVYNTPFLYPNIYTMGRDQLSLIQHPKQYRDLTAEQRNWTALTCGTSRETSPCGPGFGYGWDTPDDETPTSKIVCLWYGGDWLPIWPQSFDNVMLSFGTLLEMATTENWANLAYTCIDSVGVDMQGLRNRNPAYGALWLAVMLFGAYFVINLFIAAIVDQFERSREELGENYLMTPQQKEWIKAQESLLSIRPKRQPRPPSNLTRRSVFTIVLNPMFDRVIIGAILINTVALAAPYFGQPPSYSGALENLNTALAVLFTLEAAAKLYAFGPSMYWSDGWNRFDLAVVAASDIGILLSLGGFDVGAIGTLARVLRLGRVVRLARAMKNLRRMIMTLVITIPQLLNVGALLLLLIFIYAIAGVQLFGQVAWDGQYLVAQSNFQNVGVAMLTLYRWMTGENWNLQMYSLAGANYASINVFPCTHSPEWNDPYPTGCGTAVAYAFGYSYTVLVTFIVLQLLVAVVLEAFSDTSENDDGKLDSDALQRFTDTWVAFDKDCTMFISTTQLPNFMLALPPPMGMGGLTVVSKEELNQLIASMRLPTFIGRFVHFSDVSLACARRVLMDSMAQRGQAFSETPNSHAIAKRWEKLRGQAITLQSDFGAEHYLAAEGIRAAFRVFRFRRNLAL